MSITKNFNFFNVYNQTQIYKIIPIPKTTFIFFYASFYRIFGLLMHNHPFKGVIMTKIGDRIAQLRKQNGWSQTELAKKIGASREAIGKYERNEALPSVETAKKIADAFSVTVDYLVDETARPTFDKLTVRRLQDIEALAPEDRGHLMALMDAFLRDAKTKKAYAS
jgi:transcriptional regulator with XRE-family HTH domain